MHKPNSSLTPAQQQHLLDIAQRSILSGFEQTHTNIGINIEDVPERLKAFQASFVTLKSRDGQLRGCIGSLEPHRPLVIDVAANASAAAFRDPRFVPLQYTEIVDLTLQISVLNPPIPIQFASEQELVRLITPEIDGIVIQQGSHRATFLPSVWSSIPTPERFLVELKRKAGISPHSDAQTLQAWRYTVESFSTP